MRHLAEQLAGDFVVLDLGAAHSELLKVAGNEVCKAITLVEVDPLASAPESNGPFHRRIVVPRAVAGTSGTRPFFVRRYPECSSFLKPKTKLVQAYGLENYFTEVKVTQFDCITVPELLKSQQLGRADFFKTDLEGLDFDVLSSASEILGQSLVVQCEARFQPFFEGEASFEQLNLLLTSKGFDLVSMRPNYWKYATPHREDERDGRIAWADCVFLLREEFIERRADRWKATAKQIILAKINGLPNVAEYLFQSIGQTVPNRERQELATWLRPAARLDWKSANAVAKLPGGKKVLGAARRFFWWGYEAASRFPDAVIAPPPRSY